MVEVGRSIRWHVAVRERVSVVPRVRQPFGFHEPVGDVNAKAIDAAVKPKPQYALERFPNRGVLPVQVRLSRVKKMQVPLSLGSAS